jgi:hypothetical protein
MPPRITQFAFCTGREFQQQEVHNASFQVIVMVYQSLTFTWMPHHWVSGPPTF